MLLVCLVAVNGAVQAAVSELASHPVWLQLLHAGQTPVTAENSPFYLAADGYKHPQNELEATISAFKRQPDLQCRYPARRMFLQQHAPNLTFTRVECAEYQQYLEAFMTDSVSLIYASGFLGNPASMFGHVFLKFNGNQQHDLLDNTFSYGAQVPDSDNKLAYIVKGISGGYAGHFTNQKYHHHDLTYNESELRNLWEYRLNLTRTEVMFLLAHLWELENSTMTYYFFKQNCAYQLAQLLALVIDEPLIDAAKLWVMPVDLIMRLNSTKSGKPLYTSVIFHGSRQQSLYDHYQQLSAKQQAVLKDIIQQPAEQTTALLAQLREGDAKPVIDTLYDYVALQDVRLDELPESLKEKKRLAMVRRFELPPGQVDWQAYQPVAPHNAQLTSLLQAGYLDYPEGSAATFRFRASYYDLLTYNPGRLPFSELTTFDLTLAYKDNQKIAVKNFNLLKLINLNASQTGLPGDDALAWRLAAGYRQQANNCQHCGSGFVEGFIGKAWSPGSQFVIYGAASGLATSSNRLGGNVASGGEVGGVITITPTLAMSFSAGHQWYLNNLSAHRQYVEVESRWLISQQWDVRASFSYLEQAETGVHISYYY
ncbi:hypothetical protein GCM10011338_32070 [Alteromonas lipolytica]|uniref:Uncharacterized protein n=2 Tax=Alteromonas lipolytica TaxID=1856405 RepID=A0A1E8FIZ2_9ALTE|nr:hypothetical protein BFC17_12525 [Alteromonas lipolytica]GGF77345.1 hypothetical protein GCM10011338_32070 [Alteromonas lipolytica]